MNWHYVLWAAAVLALVVIGVTAAGYSLPQNHEAAVEALLKASPATVLATITDVAKYPEWRPGVTTVDVVPAPALTWREHAGRDVITFETLERRPDTFRVRIADRNLPFGGTWTYHVSAADGGTRLRVTENGEVYNPLFRFMSRFVFGHTATMERFVSALRQRLG